MSKNNERKIDFLLIKSVDELFKLYPKRVKNLLKNINLNYSGLEKVKEAILNQDLLSACQELIIYYRKNREDTWVNYPSLIDSQKLKVDHKKELDDIFNDIFILNNVKVKIPRLNKGNLDWNYIAPNQDIEFSYSLNRHSFLFTLYYEYRKTHDSIYAKKFNELIQDWLISNPKPAISKKSIQWRTPEVSFRILWVWTFCFFGFQNSDEFLSPTRILMLSAIHKHIEYCMKHLAKNSIRKIIELNAIITAAVLWPEFKKSDAWLEFSFKNMIPEITDGQIYPDGAQYELSHYYHYITIKNFEHFKFIVRRIGRELPKKFIRVLELMWNYYSYVIRPNGYGLLNNDSDLDNCRGMIMNAAKMYHREDWKFIASEKNITEKLNVLNGKAPLIPSVIYPWAGHAVLRNNWDNSTQWTFFDFGPYGTNHQHNDKLHISIFSHGRDLLVDSGRYNYKKDNWREYFAGTAGHNTIMIDNKNQNKYTQESTEEIDNKEYTIHKQFDFVRGTFNAGYHGIKDKISHVRTIIYMRDKYWIIFDSIYTPKPHNVNVLWHFHPDCIVKKEDNNPNCILTTNENIGNLRIKPIGDCNWEIKLIRGQQGPNIQGWYSRQYNIKEPSVCAIYTSSINISSHFVWLINTAKGKVPGFKAKIIISSEDIIGVDIKNEQFNHQIYVRQKGAEIIETPEGIEFDANCLITENKTRIIGASNR